MLSPDLLLAKLIFVLIFDKQMCFYRCVLMGSQFPLRLIKRLLYISIYDQTISSSLSRWFPFRFKGFSPTPFITLLGPYSYCPIFLYGGLFQDSRWTFFRQFYLFNFCSFLWRSNSLSSFIVFDIIKIWFS